MQSIRRSLQEKLCGRSLHSNFAYFSSERQRVDAWIAPGAKSGIKNWVAATRHAAQSRGLALAVVEAIDRFIPAAIRFGFVCTASSHHPICHSQLSRVAMCSCSHVKSPVCIVRRTLPLIRSNPHPSLIRWRLHFVAAPTNRCPPVPLWFISFGPSANHNRLTPLTAQMG